MQIPGEDNVTHLGTEEEEDEGGAAMVDEEEAAKQVRQAALINQSDELDQYD
jgi:hypothetical protein